MSHPDRRPLRHDYRVRHAAKSREAGSSPRPSKKVGVKEPRRPALTPLAVPMSLLSPIASDANSRRSAAMHRRWRANRLYAELTGVRSAAPCQEFRKTQLSDMMITLSYPT